MTPEKLSTLQIDRSHKPSPGAPRKRWRLWAVAILALAILGGVLSQGKRSIEVDTTRVVQAWPSQSLTVLNATGYVVAEAKAAVASKATGRVEWLGVREGSKVKAGEVLARLESSDVRAQLAQAQANVEAATARLRQAEAEQVDADFNLKRQQELKAQSFVAQSAVDAAQNRAQQARANVAAQQAAVRAAQASVSGAQVALDSTVIRAPFAGVVLSKNADVGDVVAPFNASADSKGAVVTIADLNTLEIDADVSETSLARARVDQSVEIQLDALPELRLAGSVSRIVPTVDRSKATIRFKIRFIEKDPRVLPDMSAKVAFLERPLKPEERSPRIAVSPDALREGKVFVLSEGIARLREITTGDRLGDLIEVKSGLEPGQTLISNPPASLKDGDRVVEKKP